MNSALDEQARTFAGDLTSTVRALAPECSPFRARLLQTAETQRFVVRQDPDTGIPLMVDGQPLLTLKVSYDCSLDGAAQYLAIDDSSLSVFAGARASGEPLFRYEYVRESRPDLPAAHLHLHAHRDAITFVMSGAGEGTKRGKQRARRTDVPRMHELHFPLGGHRFRPCLEDLLEMLVVEFGVDVTPSGRTSLLAGRDSWRRKQARSVVRDDPAEAVDVLRSLGYDVRWPLAADPPAGNPERFTGF